MNITYWKTKQAPLLPDEVDSNFMDLDQRLKALEQASPVSGIASIEIKGDSLHIEGIKGVRFPPLKLPIMTWHPKGMWESGASYSLYDVTQYKNNLYLCHSFHISSENWEEDEKKKYWSLVFSMNHK